MAAKATLAAHNAKTSTHAVHGAVSSHGVSHTVEKAKVGSGVDTLLGLGILKSSSPKVDTLHASHGITHTQHHTLAAPVDKVFNTGLSVGHNLHAPQLGLGAHGVSQSLHKANVASIPKLDVTPYGAKKDHLIDSVWSEEPHKTQYGLNSIDLPKDIHAAPVIKKEEKFDDPWNLSSKGHVDIDLPKDEEFDNPWGVPSQATHISQVAHVTKKVGPVSHGLTQKAHTSHTGINSYATPSKTVASYGVSTAYNAPATSAYGS